MKIRNGFISNSSSSSFLISYKYDSETEKCYDSNFRAKLDRAYSDKIGGDDSDFAGRLLHILLPEVARCIWHYWYKAGIQDSDEEFNDRIFYSKEDIDKDPLMDWNDLSDEEKAFFNRAFELGREVRFPSIPDSGDGGNEMETAIRYAGEAMNLESEFIDILFMKDW